MSVLRLRTLVLFALLFHVSYAFVIPNTLHQPLTSSSVLGQQSQRHTASPSTNKHLSATALPLSLLSDYNSLLLATEQSSLSLRNTDVLVFIAGLIPFGWATVEFWRRIAVGQPFGTGSDSVYIGKDNAPDESRGRRVLDRGAFLVAYLLFGIAATAIGITLYSVVTSAPMDVN